MAGYCESPPFESASKAYKKALGANLANVRIVLRCRDGDTLVRSICLFSRNNATGNVCVIGAGAMVALTGSAWPDPFVGAVLAGLFLRSSLAIFGQAWHELLSEPEATSREHEMCG